MSRKITTEIFIREASEKHKNKYDYSLTKYTRGSEKVTIICPIHGAFEQVASEHLRGRGCIECGRRTISDKVKKDILLGGSINDIAGKVDYDCYYCWRNMFSRCYSEKYQRNQPTYIGCSVCDEWKLLSKFKEWFDKNYIKGYALDKDILFKGNKIYSPSTCCFIPQEINSLLLRRQNDRGDLPIGVTLRPNNKYYVRIYKKSKCVVVGTFEDKVSAFKAYKQAKEDWIKEVAHEYYSNRKINKKVYQALMKYEVEIND